MEGKNEHIRCRVIIEVLGKPKEYVEDALKTYVEKIKEDGEFIVLDTVFADAKEQEKFWSIFAEMEIIVKGIEGLTGFCFNYMPSSVEVIKPEELAFKNHELSNIFNDLQARLHDVDMVVKKQKNENNFLKKNMNSLLKNTILICLKTTNLTEEQLSKVTGVEQSELKIFLDDLLKSNVIKKDGEIYNLI